jgi:hypothetical protein
MNPDPQQTNKDQLSTQLSALNAEIELLKKNDPQKYAQLIVVMNEQLKKLNSILSDVLKNE